MEKTILSVKDLSKTFVMGNLKQKVLCNLNIDIYEGDFTVIMGGSGAGKSTMLYNISGMDTPSSGKVYFGETEITEFSPDKLAKFRGEHCGFVFQQNYLLDYMTVYENVLSVGLLLRKRDEVEKDIEQYFKRVNIPESLFNKMPNCISGGEAQRVGIVRAVINHPDILFCDEPTGALNSANTTAVLDLLSEFNTEGQSIVMVTHDIQSAKRGNRILYLRDGIIKGECKLGKYEENNPNRDKMLTEFLSDMDW